MIPAIAGTRLSDDVSRSDRPLLVLGPSLGTSAITLWGACASDLASAFDIVAWELPGHGHNGAVPEGPFTMAELASGVLALVDEVLSERGQPGARFFYGGVSVGGAVGLQLLLDTPRRIEAAALLCTGAQIGSAQSWQERIDQVRSSGTSSLVAASAQLWFPAGFLEHQPQRGSALLHALADTIDEGYVAVCAAIAAFDVRDRLQDISAPVLAIAGSEDVSTPPASVQQIAGSVQRGRFVVLDGVAHLAPAERPADVARLMRQHLLGEPLDPPPAGARAMVEDPYAAGMSVRREVLGGSHVDRAIARTTELTRAFQDLITRYAWGEVWTRPGLDRRSRSIVTLTALVARGHHEELALHLRAALANGLTVDEIGEVLLQTAIYCGVPDANAAFRIAQQVLEEEGST